LFFIAVFGLTTWLSTENLQISASITRENVSYENVLNNSYFVQNGFEGGQNSQIVAVAWGPTDASRTINTTYSSLDNLTANNLLSGKTTFTVLDPSKLAYLYTNIFDLGPYAVGPSNNQYGIQVRYASTPEKIAVASWEPYFWTKKSSYGNRYMQARITNFNLLPKDGDDNPYFHFVRSAVQISGNVTDRVSKQSVRFTPNTLHNAVLYSRYFISQTQMVNDSGSGTVKYDLALPYRRDDRLTTLSLSVIGYRPYKKSVPTSRYLNPSYGPSRLVSYQNQAIYSYLENKPTAYNNIRVSSQFQAVTPELRGDGKLTITATNIGKKALANVALYPVTNNPNKIMTTSTSRNFGSAITGVSGNLENIVSNNMNYTLKQNWTDNSNFMNSGYFVGSLAVGQTINVDLWYDKVTRSERTTLSLNPSSETVSTNSTFSVEIKADSAGNLIGGIDVFKLNFDPNFLEVIDADNNPDNGINIQANSLLGQIMSNSVDNNAGTITIQDMIPVSADNLLAVSGTLGTINFRTKANTGTTQMYFDFEPGNPSDCNIWAKDLTTGVVYEILSAALPASFNIVSE